MSKKLQKQALEFVKNIEVKNLEFVFELNHIINILIEYNELDKASELLNHLIKHQTKEGIFELEKGTIYPELFLVNLTKLIQKSQDKKVLKRYSKPLKKCINYLEKHFDEHYLLYFKEQGVFNCLANITLLSVIDELSDLLNFHEYTKEADSLFMLKGKLELGVERYFYFKERKEEKIISEFNINNNSVKYPSKLKQFLINDYKIFSSKLYEEFVNNKKLKLKSQTCILQILYTLKEIKKQNKEEFRTLFKTYEKFLFEFPKDIISKNEFDLNNSLNKHLFHKNLKVFKEFKKEKKVSLKHNSVWVALLVLELLKDE